MNSLYLIRKYKKEDKKSVRRIACDTAFMGEPCEKFFNGRDFLADILILYFTDYEPESCFVAELNDKVNSFYGVGGSLHNFFSKNVDGISLGSVKMDTTKLDFGVIDPKGEINGLLGLDLLMKIGVIIDLKNLTLTV